MAAFLNIAIPAVLFGLAVWIAVRGWKNRGKGGCGNCPYRGGCTDEMCAKERKK